MGSVQKRSVTKNEPCPICGKPDYCWWKERKNEPGYFNLYCNRSSEAKGTVVHGMDGNDYVAVFENGAGTIFQNVAERENMFGEKLNVNGEVKKAVPRTMTVVDAVEVPPHEKLDQAYRALMSVLPLYQFHEEYLLKEGWSKTLIRRHGICSMPVAYYEKALPIFRKGFMKRETMAKNVMKRLGWKTLAGVPGAYIQKNGEWAFLSKSGILFPVYDEEGLIYRLRLRMDYLDLPVEMQMDKKGFFYLDAGERIDVTMGGPVKVAPDGSKVKIAFESHNGKYRPLTSYKMDNEAYKAGFVENVYQKGCESGNVLGFAMSPRDNFNVFWITEGEKKGIFANAALKQPVLWLPGVNSYQLVVKPHKGITPLDVMRKKGAKVAVIAFDADKAINPMVMRCFEKLAELLKEQGFKTYSAEWDMSYGKGVDDLLAAGKLPRFKEVK